MFLWFYLFFPALHVVFYYILLPYLNSLKTNYFSAMCFIELLSPAYSITFKHTLTHPFQKVLPPSPQNNCGFSYPNIHMLSSWSGIFHEKRILTVAPYHNPADGVEDISRMPRISILIVVIAAEARQLTKCRIIWCSDSEKSPSKN